MREPAEYTAEEWGKARPKESRDECRNTELLKGSGDWPMKCRVLKCD